MAISCWNWRNILTLRLLQELFQLTVGWMTCFARLLVMPARQCQGRWFLRSIHDREIVVRYRIVRLQLNRTAQGAFSGPTQAFFTEHDAEVILRVRIIRVGLGGST